MTFWKDGGQAAEPLRNFRFKVDIVGANGDQFKYSAKKVSKPSFTIQETSHKWLNHTYYFPGRLEWNTVTMTLVDPGGIGSGLNELIEKSGYAVPATQDDLKTMSKQKAKNAIQDVKITQFDADGQAKEVWTLHNVWIKDLKFGELDYESDDLTSIDVEFRYDFATRSDS